MVQCALLRGALSGIEITSLLFKCVENRADLVFDSRAADALGPHDPAQYAVRFLEFAIDQHVIVSLVVPDFFCGVLQTPFDDVIPIFAASPKALLQNLFGRGQNENRYRSWN